jgi:DNA polymerase-3 subunit epsilon
VMRRRGYRVFFAENTLWHSLFGLLFWDELFESDLLNSSSTGKHGCGLLPHCASSASPSPRHLLLTTLVL